MGDEPNWNKTASELRAPDAKPDEHLPPGVARGHQPGDTARQDQRVEVRRGDLGYHLVDGELISFVEMIEGLDLS